MNPGEVRRDPGLQPERTLLSWQRVLILLTVVGLVYLRGPLDPGSTVVPEVSPALRAGVMAFTLLLGAGLGLHLWLRWRHTRHGLREPGTGRPPLSVARPWAMVLLSAGVLALTLFVVATVLLP
ncbi:MULTISPECIES: DUF202 domain-containing protein [unclassified Nocardiopsis]|uniref:DUF202 domain-containing protein n=1 Tax=unclassified Nocardiopsis TaxID=2649073 RepID=UPI00066A1809|nr:MULTISPECIES: DUF202 domain-containing protein [unclassified Nocardiopsis]MBQ1083507.1 DUF202 domain-containing protein [Nocardiopsis sp. B62]PWV45457.1 uncharacterized protein DUF202 [Nocardiopsis sp. L17-MgMaSL7]